MIRNCLLILALVALAGCSGSDETADEGVFDDQVETLERARDVEQQLKDAADAQRKALDEQER